MHFGVPLRAINLRNIVRSAESIGVTKKSEEHSKKRSSDLSNGRYWDRTSDFFGVNEALVPLS